MRRFLAMWWTPACRKMYIGYVLVIALWIVMHWLGFDDRARTNSIPFHWHPGMGYLLTLIVGLCGVLAWVRRRRGSGA